MAGRVGGDFDLAEQLEEHLCSRPDAASESEPAKSRWTLARIEASFPLLHGYSRAGVSKYLHACGIKLRQGRPQYLSPDAASKEKEARLLMALRLVGQHKERLAALFLDEMS